MREATQQIALLGTTLAPTLETAGLPKLLAAKAKEGCRVRILVSQAVPRLAPFLQAGNIEIRVLEAAPPHTIHRFDDQLLLALHLAEQDERQAPLLDIKRAAAGGVFDRLAENYDKLWNQAARPAATDIEPSTQPARPVTPVEPTVVERPASDRRSALASPRRWPGRSS